MVIKKKISGKDILLILLYSPGLTKKYNEPILGKTRITKMMFIFKKEIMRGFDNIDEKSMPEFFSYNYGPFSKELYDDLKFFESIGLIQEENTKNELSEAEEEESMYWISEDEDSDSDDYDYYEIKYSLTEKGYDYVKDNLWNELSDDQIEFLVKFKNKINTLSLDMLLDYVYNKYPKYTDKSVIRDKYIRN